MRVRGRSDVDVAFLRLLLVHAHVHLSLYRSWHSEWRDEGQLAYTVTGPPVIVVRLRHLRLTVCVYMRCTSLLLLLLLLLLSLCVARNGLSLRLLSTTSLMIYSSLYIIRCMM